MRRHLKWTEARGTRSDGSSNGSRCGYKQRLSETDSLTGLSTARLLFDRTYIAVQKPSTCPERTQSIVYKIAARWTLVAVHSLFHNAGVNFILS